MSCALPGVELLGPVVVPARRGSASCAELVREEPEGSSECGCDVVIFTGCVAGFCR